MQKLESKQRKAVRRIPRGISTVLLLCASLVCYNGRLGAIQDQPDVANPTYNSARQSLEWMTKSLMRVAEKLDEVSSTLDPNATEEQISRDVKQAMREAFAEFSTWPGGPTEKSTKSGVDGVRGVPAGESTQKRSLQGVGEVSSDEEILSVESNGIASRIMSGGANVQGRKELGVRKEESKNEVEAKTTSEPSIRSETSLDRSLDQAPIWDTNAPAWVRDRVIDREYVRVAIESSVESSLEECRAAMQQQAYAQVLDVLDAHVLQYSKARSIPELNEEFVMKELFKQETEYDLVLDRPSGTYHQLYRLLSIGPDAMYKMKRWDRESAMRSRVKQAVGTTVGSLGLLAFASGITGWVSRRESSKKRVTQ